MATVKFDEGTKFETTLELEDGEGVIFVRPLKNKTMVMYSDGCLKPLIGQSRSCYANLVITNKRIAAIPVPPNKKNRSVGSFYFKDINKAAMEKGRDAAEDARSATFKILLKPKGETVRFMILYQMSLKNIVNITQAQMAVDSANNAAVIGASLRTFDEAHYTSKSLDKYYAKMAENAKARAGNMDFSTAEHAEIRDYLVDVINQFVEIANS